MEINDVQQSLRDKIDITFVDEYTDTIMELTISVRDAKMISDFVIENNL